MAKINEGKTFEQVEERLKPRTYRGKRPQPQTIEFRDKVASLRAGRQYGFSYELEEGDNPTTIKSRVTATANFLNKWIHADPTEDEAEFWVWVDPRPRQTRQKKEDTEAAPTGATARSRGKRAAS